MATFADMAIAAVTIKKTYRKYKARKRKTLPGPDQRARQDQLSYKLPPGKACYCVFSIVPFIQT